MALASDLEKGTCFLYNNQVVRVTRKEIVNCGTHCHTKLKIFVEPAFGGGGEKAVNLSHSDKVDIVEIRRKKGQLISISGNKAQVMDFESYETFDAEPANEELGKELVANDIVTYAEYLGKVIILEKLR